MNFQLDSIIEVLLCNDNQRRIEAERFIDEVPTNAFDAGIDAFLLSMSHENSNVSLNLYRWLLWEPFS